ncbi:MAG: hypothetical protein COT26_00890 [Candidatus Kerfeldbacteria bacterium CG08_land_8_20_14_0_20_43_14]|uniref:Ferric oxidoreductase domain-containing protein n=1 Tax=Candidatus Kerfeldbacteria bacterium CG08_land_8_20_14_0_20_43_14 TaxID=2014246 RepID=A0A2H0YR00_9BACT|nr:MAG: hypothetical protein COT26_00890 [Candidatus Kerfeldbacteria bacterium CG08_land_8_20_14_0_20_43_14]
MKVKILLFLAVLAICLPLRVRAVTTIQNPAAAKQAVLLADSEEQENEIENQQDKVENFVPSSTINSGQNQNNVIQPVQPLGTANTNSEANVDNAQPEAVQNNTSAAPVVQPVNPFPWAWLIARAAGIASFILLGFLTMTGLLLTTGAFFRLLSPAHAWSLHRAIASMLLVSVVTHVASLLFDHFINLRLQDLLVPFVSFYRPALLALGILGFYILLLVLATSLYTMTNHPRFWRLVHYLAFPMFVLLFLHGILLGTDTKQIWMQVIYWATGSLVGLTIIYRILWRYYRRQMPVVEATGGLIRK